MDKDLKREALRAYLKYFKTWFIAAGVLFLVWIVSWVATSSKRIKVRANDSAPTERVYDNAEVLSDDEEEALRTLIAEKEKQLGVDIVLVTINQEVGVNDADWNLNMRNLADDFYDENNYGFNKVHGDGMLLLDNWYEGEKGSWLSTCGSVYEKFDDTDISTVIAAVNEQADASPYLAYVAYVETAAEQMNFDAFAVLMFPLVVLIPLITLIVFLVTKLHVKYGEDTVQLNTYVEGGRPKVRDQRDVFRTKMVTRRHVPRPENNSGGGRSGGGGGHVSSGGVSHGGGGGRR